MSTGLDGLALVLGGGGSAGVAWEVGVLHALVESGVDVQSARTVVGTSAGSIVGARLRAGGDTAALFADACRPVAARPMDLDYPALEASWGAATAGARSAADARRRIGDLARSAATMPAVLRHAEIAALLPTRDWPEGGLQVVAVNAEDGQVATFDAGSGVALVDAVAASCAVPGVWPPVEVVGQVHIDGAVRSTTNADLAAGHQPVLVLAPMPPLGGLARELDRLPAGTRHLAIEADAGALAAFGANPLDPRSGPAAAREGYRQGRAAAAGVSRFLA